MVQYEPLLYRPEWKPVVNIGDVVDLLMPSQQQILLIDHIEMKPFQVIDWGTVNNAATIAAKQALNAQNQDILAVGPDQFIQIRVRLDPRDFLVNPTSGNPTLLQAYQPGPAAQRWATIYQSYSWDAINQAYWPSLQPTELFSYYDQTPEYSVINQSGANQTTSRIWFQTIVYSGTQLGGDPGDAKVTRAVGRSMLQFLAQIPVAVKQTRNRANSPAFA